MLSFRSPLWAVLFAIPLLVGCAKDKSTRDSANLTTGSVRWTVFPVDLQVDSQIMGDAAAKQDLNDAISYWETRAGRRIFNILGPWDHVNIPYAGDVSDPSDLLGNVLFIQNSWPFDASIAGKTIVFSQGGFIESSVVLINGNTSLCTADCPLPANNSKVSRRKLIAHELGHFLGFSHTTSPTDVMYPNITPGGDLESLEVSLDDLHLLTN